MAGMGACGIGNMTEQDMTEAVLTVYPRNAFAEQVAIGVSARLGWSVEETRNVIGDTSEYEAEGLAVAEAISVTVDAIRASA